jgi:Histidine kinase-, DNA gyrase B-, and HSP90-like ATPase
MTMLSLSRRLGITPRPDHEYDPAAAGWLDSVRPESVDQEAGQPPLVPQQWAGTSAVRDRQRAHYPADDQVSGGHDVTARGPHPLGYADRAAVPPQAFGPPPDPRLGQTQPIKRPSASPPPRPDGAWPEICDQFGSHLLVLAEQLRASLNQLEEGEDDPERLKRLYQVDHAVTRMRLASRQLRTLAGRSEERLAGFTTSLLDVIRMASSAIEWYPQVSVGPVVELAVPGYAADDVATLVSALLDNATRYSPGTVTVSCHLLEEGGALLRIEDTGIGIGRGRVTRLNAVFAGPVPEVDKSTGRHTGFPVVHRIARKHSIGVRFASRRAPGTGTVAMVILPPQLLCAIPVEATPPPAAPDEQPTPPAGPAEAGTALAVLPEPAMPAVISPAAEAPVAVPDAVAPEALAPEHLTAQPDQDVRPCELPRREPAGRRADQPRPAEAATASPLQQAAARRAFADELGAFSQGIHNALAARGITGGVVRPTTDNAPIEEGAQA